MITTNHGLLELGWNEQTIEQNTYLEYTNVIANPLLLVLSYTLGNPGDVSDFLRIFLAFMLTSRAFDKTYLFP